MAKPKEFDNPLEVNQELLKVFGIPLEIDAGFAHNVTIQAKSDGEYPTIEVVYLMTNGKTLKNYNIKKVENEKN